MSTKALLLSLILFALFAATLAFGQVESKPAAETFTIADQPSSPLKLTLERQGPHPGSVFIKLTNNGKLPVRGYVLRMKSEERDHVYTSVFVNRFIDPGQTRPAGISGGRVGEVKPQTVEISLDYVGFADGTGWGLDSLGRSKNIFDYIKGHDTARAKLAEVLAGQDGAAIITHVGLFSGGTFGEPVQMPAGRERNHFDMGYETVLIRLRQMKGPREDEAKELARRLELMQKSVPR